MRKAWRRIGCTAVAIAGLLAIGPVSLVMAEDNTKEQIELEFWSLIDQTEDTEKAWEQAIAEYEAAHPNVKIKQTKYEGEAYKIKLKSAVAADELPDIFFSWAGGFSQPFVEAGKMLALDDVYENYKDDINASMLDSCTYNDKLYGSVMSTQASLLYYNRAMFEEYGVKVPETYEELVNACHTFIDNDITPFAISAKDTWGPATVMDNLMLKTVGHDNVIDTITRNGGTFEEDEFLEAATRFTELVEMGAFLENASGINTDEAYQYFVNGTCPMWVMIDSLGNNVMNTIENIDDYGVTRFPVVGENASVTDLMGGCGEIYCVAASTEYPDEAGNAVFELTRSAAAYMAKVGTAMSAWNDQPLGEGSADFMYDVQDYKANATSYMLWWDTTMIADDAQEYLGLLQELYIGNITAEEFCEAMSQQLSN